MRKGEYEGWVFHEPFGCGAWCRIMRGTHDDVTIKVLGYIREHLEAGGLVIAREHSFAPRGPHQVADGK